MFAVLSWSARRQGESQDDNFDPGFDPGSGPVGKDLPAAPPAAAGWAAFAPAAQPPAFQADFGGPAVPPADFQADFGGAAAPAAPPDAGFVADFGGWPGEGAAGGPPAKAAFEADFGAAPMPALAAHDNGFEITKLTPAARAARGMQGADRPCGGRPPAEPAEPAGGVCWSPADRDESFVFLGWPLVKGRRADASTGWSGCRASRGIAQGRGAFAVRNESGGNMRVGWSLGGATLELGMDDRSFGYGGTATKSHAGKYGKYGQTYGKGDIVVALIDLERHALGFMKNGHAIPGDAWAIPRHLWGEPFFPHVLVKEATVLAYFGGPGCPFPPQRLPAGFSWLSALPLTPSRLPCDLAAVRVEAADAVAEVDVSQLEQGAHRHQFEDWKVKVNAYTGHFRPLLACEYEAEKEAVRQRVRRGTRQLESTGHGCAGLRAALTDGRVALTRPGGIPRLPELGVGRSVLITEEEGAVDLDNPSVSIGGEIDRITDGAIVVSTTYDRLPEGRLFRVDLGPNMSTYERIDRVLDMLQSCEKPSKKVKSRMGIVSPGTPLADAVFADVAETSMAALRWDPSTRPKASTSSDVSSAARQAHAAAPPRPPAEAPPEPRQLNPSQQRAVDIVLEEQRRLSLLQGPPGTGKTTTAVEVVVSWLRAHRGPVLATAFSNKGVDNLAQGLHRRGVTVLRVGACDPDLPYSMESHLEYYGHAGKGKGKGAAKGGQSDVIRKADVVCATVIGSGMGLLRSSDFRFVMVDEAAQIIEPASLIPLSKGSVQVVMVGDQCQLPATVLSHEAQQGGLDVSQFDRLISMGMEIHMLSIQYRMHPAIAEFPSQRFYEGRLEAGVRPQDRPCPTPHGLQLGPVVVVHVGAAESSQGMSKSNAGEASCVEFLLRALRPTCPLDDVGVITPYSAQVSLVRRELGRGLGHDAELVQVSSVDAFQGSEKEAIILSMVRSNPRGDIGFVGDWRRLNVAATRAKRLLVVVCNVATLGRHALWRDFLGYGAGICALEWDGRGLAPLSAGEPWQALAGARGAQRPGPLPLRGDCPTEGGGAPGGDLSWDSAAPVAEEPSGDEWDAGPPDADADGWGDAPVAACEGGQPDWWDPQRDGDVQLCRLAVGDDGALVDLETTRWGMRVEGIDPRSRNRFEVGSTIVGIAGVALEQEDGSDDALLQVEDAFRRNFWDGAEVLLAAQEERLVPPGAAARRALELCGALGVAAEPCPQGVLVYGPRRALDALEDHLGARA
ncbi:unnamed protein product [Prorocentrum cordatum]|uniref:B30.2/SPRY domain-containing protein n=1 Tax=Prorocentrum cordatum TaxID=2364126 RepID=A0ABN9RXX8_9DINO|nr:unnamed protein product [Polarella glacialis]